MAKKRKSTKRKGIQYAKLTPSQQKEAKAFFKKLAGWRKKARQRYILKKASR